MNWLLNLDTQLFHSINRGWINPFFDVLMPILSAEEGAIILIGILIITAIIDRRKGWIVLIFTLIAVALTDPIVVRILKPLIARPRPCKVMFVHLLDRCSGSPSFPSAHATNIFSYAIAYSMVYRKALWGMIPLAVGVALSRVYVGVHYPLDILAGSILGTGIGLGMGYIALTLIKRREKKRADTNGVRYSGNDIEKKGQDLASQNS